ncbi:MAG TPA: Smr/MutS family protein [Deltaproteobacteria bacterium]|jgi:DNA-nicking Smr family endonuclease|nr:Smr/MutS family protein [Deltaproteobacteria bacterium]HOI08538.1 Smr/MutS family protein [Deltaproteobacteria bacterium]
MAKKDDLFHTPFKKLKGVKIKPKAAEKPKKAPEPPKRPPDDAELFASAMKGVVPMDNDCITPEPTDTRAVLASIQENVKKQDQEALEALKALVRGSSHFDITMTGEYLEGHAIPVDPATMKKLKSGELTIEGHLDLHGHTRLSAEQALQNFILNAHALGQRTLLIIHGRGLKSSQGPVLKEHLVRWLTTGALSHLVLAFASARPCDGGTGALYVLLKRRPKKSQFKRPL